MDLHAYLMSAARDGKHRALPILSFPAAKKVGVSTKQLVTDPGAQTAVIRFIAENTDTLAAVSPMDLSVEAEAFGAAVSFPKNELPTVSGQLVSDQKSADALQIPAPDAGRGRIFLESIGNARLFIKEKPLLGGMIGPFSLAGRLAGVSEIMYLCLDEPMTVHTLLEKTTDYLISYAAAMKRVGADGVLMAEPLAGVLSPAIAASFSIPYVKKIIGSVTDKHFQVIYHNCGGSILTMLPEIFSQGAAAYHFGNAVPLSEILKNAPADTPCMGNLDPVSDFSMATPDDTKKAVGRLLCACGHFPNFIPSSGCDLPANTSWGNIDAFFEALRYDRRG